MSHATDMAINLMGNVKEVQGVMDTFIKKRPIAPAGASHYAKGSFDDEMKDVESSMLQMLFQTYRSTQGDKVVPSLADGMANRLQSSPGAQTVLLAVISFVWLAQNSWFTFYGVQFLAQLFEAYEELYPKMDMLMYRSRARFNYENY